MDIDYLLFLQDFRNSIGDAWTPFMLWISHFATAYLMVFPAFIYWCIDKKKGLFILSSSVVSVAVNSIIKLTACVYRPWVRDPRIEPAEEALAESTGYSFPSGHTSTSAPIYSGIAISFWKKSKIPAVICFVMLALTMFSRNYLGVHTPQDVIAGLIIGLASLYGVHRLFLYLEKYPEKEDLFLLTGALISVAAIIYISVKPYPMDYLNGELLADPARLKIDGYKDLGLLLALCIGRYLEKRFVGFKEAGLNPRGILISLAGLIPLLIITKLLSKPMDGLFGVYFGGMLSRMLLILLIIVLWPAVIKMVTGEKREAS